MDTAEGLAGCCGDSSAPPTNRPGGRFVYAVGHIDARFPTAAIEREYRQAVARDPSLAGKTDPAVLRETLSRPENRYLARSMCWVLSIEGLPAYVLKLRDPFDLDGLIATLRETPSPAEIDAVVGTRGPMAPPETCGGRSLPIAIVNQIFSFDLDALLHAIETPAGMTDDDFAPVALDFFTRVQRMADNLGAEDAHRAVNYLAMRYATAYELAARQLARNAALTGVESQRAPLGGDRAVHDVIFTYTNRASGTSDRYRARVDVTEEFPFLVSPLAAYVDR